MDRLMISANIFNLIRYHGGMFLPSR